MFQRGLGKRHDAASFVFARIAAFPEQDKTPSRDWKYATEINFPSFVK